MAFPIPFVAGAVVGAVSTYVYKDETARQWLGDKSTKLKNGTQSFIGSFRKKDKTAGTDTPTGEVIEGTAEAVNKESAVADDTTPSSEDKKTDHTAESQDSKK